MQAQVQGQRAQHHLHDVGGARLGGLEEVVEQGQGAGVILQARTAAEGRFVQLLDIVLATPTQVGTWSSKPSEKGVVHHAKIPC